MRRPLLASLLVLASLLSVAPAADARRGDCVAGLPGPRCDVWTARVVTVGDGDTLDARVHGDRGAAWRRIRIAGIQAMELSVYSARRRVGDCHGVAATLRLEGLVRRSRGLVRLAAQDPFSTSRKRLLRSVAVRIGGRWRDVGRIMIEEGLALWWPTRQESAGNAAYSVLAQRALAARRGLYDPVGCGVGPSAASPMALRLNWDADGDDSANPGGEWLQVRNLDPVNPVALGGWYVRDSSLRRYTFPSSAVAPPGGRVTVNVGTTGDGVSVFAWGLRAPLFDKASGDHQALGDGAYLFDPLGNVRASLIYPCRVNCADPRAGAVRLRATPTGAEGFALTNVSAGAVSLDGTQLRTRRAGYHFGPDAVLAPGQTLLLAVRGDPAQDTALDRHWGLTRTILDDADDLVRLTTDTDVTLACAAWGDRGC